MRQRNFMCFFWFFFQALANTASGRLPCDGHGYSFILFKYPHAERILDTQTAENENSIMVHLWDL